MLQGQTSLQVLHGQQTVASSLLGQHGWAQGLVSWAVSWGTQTLFLLLQDSYSCIFQAPIEWSPVPGFAEPGCGLCPEQGALLW